MHRRATENGRVYLDFYELEEIPFSITPDPQFLFASRTHRDVIEKILYGIRSRMGFILLVGEVGTGKTTVCRTILDRLEGESASVYVINPSLSGKELISTILDDLGLDPPPRATKKGLIDTLNRFLLAADPGKPVVIIVDDAQTMSAEALEDLRLLSNLETDKVKLIQLVLAGQPELIDLLARPQLRQFMQRVAVSCRLDCLDAAETAAYISRRLYVSGEKGRIRFDRGAVRAIHRSSGGVPRLINKVCDYALTASYLSDAYRVRSRHVRMALRELGPVAFPVPGGVAGRSAFRRRRRVGAAAITLGVLGALFFGFVGGGDPEAVGRLSLSAGKPLVFSIPAAPPAGDPAPVSGGGASVPEGREAGAPAVAAEERRERPRLAVALPPPMQALVSTGLPEQPAGAAGGLPVTLMLGSYKSARYAMRAASIFGRKLEGVEWCPVEIEGEGTWYRVFSGKFQTRREAAAFMALHGLDDALALAMPWSVAVGPLPSTGDVRAVEGRLAEHACGSSRVERRDGGFVLTLGAFVTREGAETLAEAIHRLDIGNAFVVMR